MENNTTVSLTINPLGYQHKNEEPETKTIRFQYPEGYNKQKFFADGLEKSFPAVQADQFVKLGIAVFPEDEANKQETAPEVTDALNEETAPAEQAEQLAENAEVIADVTDAPEANQTEASEMPAVESKEEAPVKKSGKASVKK